MVRVRGQRDREGQRGYLSMLSNSSADKGVLALIVMYSLSCAACSSLRTRPAWLRTRVDTRAWL